MAVYQVVYQEPIPMVRAEEPTQHYVEAKVRTIRDWHLLPDDARGTAIKVWAAEAAEVAEAWTVVPKVEAVSQIRDVAKRWRAEAEAAEEAVPEMVREVLRSWTLADATKVVGKRTVREVEREWTEGVTPKRSYTTREVEVTAIEDLARATGLGSGKSPWHYLHITLKDTDGVEPEIWDYIRARFWEERSGSL
jgi:hypothetical protein